MSKERALLERLVERWDNPFVGRGLDLFGVVRDARALLATPEGGLPDQRPMTPAEQEHYKAFLASQFKPVEPRPLTREQLDWLLQRLNDADVVLATEGNGSDALEILTVANALVALCTAAGLEAR